MNECGDTIWIIMGLENSIEFSIHEAYAIFFPCSYVATYLEVEPIIIIYLHNLFQFFSLILCHSVFDTKSILKNITRMVFRGKITKFVVVTNSFTYYPKVPLYTSSLLRYFKEQQLSISCPQFLWFLQYLLDNHLLSWLPLRGGGLLSQFLPYNLSHIFEYSLTLSRNGSIVLGPFHVPVMPCGHFCYYLTCLRHLRF